MAGGTAPIHHDACGGDRDPAPRPAEDSLTRLLVEDALVELADRDLQRRLWLGRDAAPGLMSSIEEATCGLFDDSALAAKLEQGPVFGPVIDGHLRALGRRLAAAQDHLAFDDPLDDRRLVEVRDLAASVSALLRSTWPVPPT